MAMVAPSATAAMAKATTMETRDHDQDLGREPRHRRRRLLAEVDEAAFAQAHQTLRHQDRVAAAVERYQPLLDALSERLRVERLEASMHGECLRVDALDRELDMLHVVFNAASRGGRL
jgi:hypothetical protein